LPLIEQQGAQATLPIVFGGYLTHLPLALTGQSSYQAYQNAKFGRNLLRTLLQNITDTFHSIPCLIGYCPLLGVAQVEILYKVHILSLTYQSTITTRTGTFSVQQLPFHQPHLLLGPEASRSSGHLVERLLVLMATFYVFLILCREGLLVVVNLVYLTVYLYFMCSEPCLNGWNSQVSKPRIPLQSQSALVCHLAVPSGVPSLCCDVAASTLPIALS